MNNDIAEQKYPLTFAFLQQYTLAVQVRHSKLVNDGFPVITGFIVDKTIDNPQAMLESRRPIVEISYRATADSPNKPIQFYAPDGTVAMSLSEAEMETAPDDEINPKLNALWGLEADSPFGRKIGEALVGTCSMLTAASLIAEQTGVPSMQVFDAIQRGTYKGADVSVLNASDGVIRDDKGNPVTSLAALREAATEGASNEG